MKEKQPVLGRVETEVEEDLLSNQEKQAKRKLEVMDMLDRIKAPIICTVVVEPESFDYRNRAFWEAFAKKDEITRRLLVELLNRNKASGGRSSK